MRQSLAGLLAVVYQFYPRGLWQQPSARAITEEIVATFPDYEPMPPEIGNLVVPDIVAGNIPMGKATLYHCLFTDTW